MRPSEIPFVERRSAHALPGPWPAQARACGNSDHGEILEEHLGPRHREALKGDHSHRVCAACLHPIPYPTSKVRREIGRSLTLRATTDNPYSNMIFFEWDDEKAAENYATV